MKAQRTIRKGPSGAATIDGLTNVVARLGADVGTNALSASHYRRSTLTQNPRQLEAMYETSWIVGKVIDCVAEDMTRDGIMLIGTDKDDEVQRALTSGGVWNSLTSLIKWGRLYGGAIGVMIVEGQALNTPLRVDSVQRNAFKGITVIDRWRLAIDGERDAAGLPEFYRLSVTGELVHKSRVLRYIGTELPYWSALLQQGWGASVIERMDDRIVSFDSVTMGTANLVFKAYLRTVKVDRLREVLAAGGTAENNLVKMFKLMQVLQTNEGLTLLDKNDELQTNSYTFAGLSDVILQFGQQLAGASGIPLVRLFGQSPAGLNATGDADIRNYYDSINQQQEANLRSIMDRLLAVVYRSATGSAPPVEFAFDFNPLWQLSESEKATIGKTNAETITMLEGSDVLSRAQAMKETQRQAAVTGIGSSITDEDIEEAEAEPPMPTAPEGAVVPGENGETPEDAPGTTDAAGWRKWFKRR